MSSLFERALLCQNQGRPPIWLMRQAGRYLPSYKEVRSKVSLRDLFHDSELAAEVTLQPVEQFGLDAAIVFSDILVILETLGFTISYPETGGPLVENLCQYPEDLLKLKVGDVKDILSYVPAILQKVKKHTTVPLIGFCGAPFTVAAYLLDRPVKEEMKKTKLLLWQHPQILHHLLKQITEATKQYLLMQIKAGAVAIQIFDSWAGALSTEDFIHFSLPYLKELVQFVKEQKVPVIFFCRGTTQRKSEILTLAPTAVSLDFQSDIVLWEKELPSSMAIQGNLDPTLLLASPDIVEGKARELLQKMQGSNRWIFNLGHGVLPESRPESVLRLVQVVQGKI